MGAQGCVSRAGAWRLLPLTEASAYCQKFHHRVSFQKNLVWNCRNLGKQENSKGSSSQDGGGCFRPLYVALFPLARLCSLVAPSGAPSKAALLPSPTRSSSFQSQVRGVYDINIDIFRSKRKALD